MRSRIMKELAHESKGMDIKLGPGGIGEIEFYVQLLQLRNAREFPEVLVQNTLTAISRLAKKQVISPSEKNTYYKSYKYFRKIQTYLRLNEEHVIAEGTEVTALASKLMKHKSQKEFLSRLEKVREDVLSAIRDI
jgi:glutamate-ammonia-ligase adenylyltransferase